ncbi:MAG: hypothetical protein E5V17_04930, partial [Mesorhizobium sp.]
IFHGIRVNFKRQAKTVLEPTNPEENVLGPWNLYGCRHPHAITLVMRYVIVIITLTFALIWDGLYNQGRYLDTTVREVSRIVRYVTGAV